MPMDGEKVWRDGFYVMSDLMYIVTRLEITDDYVPLKNLVEYGNHWEEYEGE